MRRERSSRTSLLALPLLLLLVGCHGTGEVRDPAPEWALAIHGGAGVSPDIPNAPEYAASLHRALAAGETILAGGGTSLDAVTEVIRILEDDPLFNAGRGAVLTAEGRCELDASIMDGATKNCGAVASVTSVRNPILLARDVMEHSRHVFLVGEGAEVFAVERGHPVIDNTWLRTEHRVRSLERRKAEEARESSALPAGTLPRETYLGTVGAVALDSHGHLAAATSTGGLTNKRYGRVGDSPVIGAGTYADDASCAVSCTGQGELYIRHAIAHSLAARVALTDATLEEAAHALIHDVLPHDSGGLIAIDRHGTITLPFNTAGMHRGRVTSAEPPVVWSLDVAYPRTSSTTGGAR